MQIFVELEDRYYVQDVDRDVLEGYEKVQQSVNKLTFNEQLRFKTTIVSNDSGATYQPRKTTLYLNFFTPSKPNESKLAGVVTLDLAKCLDGRQQQQYPLERELDKNSWIRFAVDCKFIRQLDPQEVSESFSIMKLVQENISEHQSIRSGDSKEKRSAHHNLSKSIDKIVDKFFTPRTSKEESPPSRPAEQSGFSPVQTSHSGQIREQLHNTLPERTERSTENRQKSRQDQQYETPKPRGSDLGRSSVVVGGLNRPPPSTPAIPKEQVSNLLAKFQSERRLRESLQIQLEKARDQNQSLKSRTEQISDRLQQSEVKVRRLAESNRKQQQSQTVVLTRQNQQLKDDIKQMRYTYQQQKSISESLQRELIQLNYLYESEKQTNLSLQKLADECRIKHQQSIAVSPESLRSSNIIERSKMMDSLQTAYKQKDKYCNDLQVELENVRRQLEEVEVQLEQQREQTSKFIENMRAQEHGNEREQQLEERIMELEEELENRNNVQPRESEDEFTNRIIEEFNMKEQEIRAIFGVLQKECMTLIEAMRSKQNKSTISTAVQVNLIDQPFSYAHSPIRAAHQEYQASTDDLKKSVYQSVMDEEQVARIRSQNESLRYEAQELQNSLVDSRRTLWDFKQLVFKNNQRSQRSIVKAEKSTRYRHHLRHIDRLKIQYTDKLRQMYEEIMHLNEIIYLNSAKQKQMVREVEQIQEKYKFMESASREMRERLKECREKHHDLIESLRTTNARQATEMAKLKHTVSEQQEQLSSLKVQLDNMDNSDLLIVNNPNDAEELQVELSKASNENKELERRYGEMMSYIEQIRAQQQKSEEMLILKDSEIEDLKEQLRKKKLTYPIPEDKHILLIDEGEDQPTSSRAIREVLDVLRANQKGVEQMREVKSALKNIFDIYEASENVDDAQSRTEKMMIMERIRQASVEFQRLKIDRIKSLQGSSELRKEFLKSVRPLQSKFDELLSFGQGVLNSKTTNRRRPVDISKKN